MRKINEFPYELIIEIALYVNGYYELMKMKKICKSFMVTINSKIFWKELNKVHKLIAKKKAINSNNIRMKYREKCLIFEYRSKDYFETYGANQTTIKHLRFNYCGYYYEYVKKSGDHMFSDNGFDDTSNNEFYFGITMFIKFLRIAYLYDEKNCLELGKDDSLTVFGEKRDRIPRDFQKLLNMSVDLRIQKKSLLYIIVGYKFLNDHSYELFVDYSTIHYRITKIELFNIKYKFLKSKKKKRIKNNPKSKITKFKEFTRLSIPFPIIVSIHSVGCMPIKKKYYINKNVPKHQKFFFVSKNA